MIFSILLTNSICIAISTPNIVDLKLINSNIPETNSKNILALDRKTLTVLYNKNGFDKVPMASTTKILTCILVLENIQNLDDFTIISKNASSISGSTLGLKFNMKITIRDLLSGLMLRSGNDCAVALAEYTSGNVTEFCNLMNQKANELNLNNSHFTSPHGLDNEDHYTTAYELAIITDYALKNETFQKIVSTKNYSVNLGAYTKTISNTNELLNNFEGVYGVKTGFTFNAGRCLVSACRNSEMDIIVIVLGADTKNIRTQDSKNIINYIFNSYSYVDLSEIINNNFQTFLIYFNENYNLQKSKNEPILDIEYLDNYEFPLKNDSSFIISTKIYFSKNLSSNSTVYSTIGRIDIYNNNDFVCSLNIILENNILPKKSFDYFIDLICLNLNLFG